ncbi:MAG: hypothetical protein SGI71_12915 [Verrucomicrobiota bacterium]|nr:hypothetical protein [Verrucomicrobiota bacterium]
MNRIKFVLLGFILVLLGSATTLYWWVFLQADQDPVDLETLLPSDTFFYAEVKDWVAFKEALKTTAYAKIYYDPIFQKEYGDRVVAFQTNYTQQLANGYLSAFIKSKPEDRLMEYDRVVKVVTVLQKYIPMVVQGRSVAAVTRIGGGSFLQGGSIEKSGPMFEGVVGYEVVGNEREQEFFKELSSVLGNAFFVEKPKFKRIRYVRMTDADGTIFCYARLANWSFWTVGEPAMKELITRYREKNGDSLASNADYQKCIEKVDSQYHVRLFFNAQVFADFSRGKIELAKGEKGVRWLNLLMNRSAFASTINIENGQFRDKSFWLSPVAKRGTPKPIWENDRRHSLSLTTTNTAFYHTRNCDWPALFEFAANDGTETNLWISFAKVLNAEKINLQKDVFDTLGMEGAVIADWPEGSLFPNAFVAIEVTHPDQLKASLENIMATLAKVSNGEFGFTREKVSGAKNPVYIWSVAGHVKPHLTVTDKFLLLAFSDQSMKAAVSNAANPQPITIQASPVFSAGLKEIPDLGSQFTFINTPQLWFRMYNSAPYASLLGSTMGSTNVSTSWMPPVDGFLPHLTPSIGTEVVDEDGFTSVSISGFGKAVYLPAIYYYFGTVKPAWKKFRTNQQEKSASQANTSGAESNTVSPPVPLPGSPTQQPNTVVHPSEEPFKITHIIGVVGTSDVTIGVNNKVVVDVGNTFDCEINGQRTKVKFIGINKTAASFEVDGETLTVPYDPSIDPLNRKK